MELQFKDDNSVDSKIFYVDLVSGIYENFGADGLSRLIRIIRIIEETEIQINNDGSTK